MMNKILKLLGLKSSAPKELPNNIMGENSIKNSDSNQDDIDALWQQGLVRTVNITYNPQEFADKNYLLYQHNNEILIWVCGFLVIATSLFSIATLFAFFNIREPKFFTTTPNGQVELIYSHTNPYELHRVPSEETVMQESAKWLKENKNKVRQFEGKQYETR